MGHSILHKKLSPVLPSLTLHLSSPEDKVFRPNDTIEGQITISTPTPILPQAIEVSLWGHSSVWLITSSGTGTDTTYHHYKDNVSLFDVTYNLFTQPQQLQPGQTYSFPFHFRVPEGTGSQRLGCYRDDLDVIWTVQPHQLPPTFTWGSYTNRPDMASVYYGITARLVCQGFDVGNYQHPLSATSPILFRPLPPESNAPCNLIRFSGPFSLTSSSLAGRDPSSIGFRKKLSDRLSSDTPKLEFELGVEMPDIVISGTEFQFKCTFNVLDRSQNVRHIPVITFKVLKLSLLGFTSLRAGYERTPNALMYESSSYLDRALWFEPTGPYSGLEHAIYRMEKTVLNSVPEAQVMELEDVPLVAEKKGTRQANSAEAWFSSRLPGFTPPDFQSFAIARAYRIKVKMEVRIGEKKFEHEAKSNVRNL